MKRPPCPWHDQLSDEQRHILLDAHDQAMVRLADEHARLRMACQELADQMHQAGDPWARCLAALVEDRWES